MKRKLFFVLAFFIATILLGSCTKETTYTFTDNSTSSSSITQDVYLLEYDATGSRVASHGLKNVTNGYTKMFTANSHAEKSCLPTTMGNWQHHQGVLSCSGVLS